MTSPQRWRLTIGRLLVVVLIAGLGLAVAAPWLRPPAADADRPRYGDAYDSNISTFPAPILTP